MDTIIRTSRGNYVIIDVTVEETIRELAKKPGYISIKNIQDAINNQLLDRREHVTRKMVMRGVIRILEKSRKRK